MDNLIIKSNQLFSRKVIGIFWILFGIISFVFVITGKSPMDNGDWMRFIGFCLIGVIVFSPLSGSDKSQIEICEGCLKIIWQGWIRKVTVLDSEIESIILAKDGVLIKRKDKRPLKIKLFLQNRQQKNQVFEFFTEYAREKNLVQE
jgi:hypothetical protein